MNHSEKKNILMLWCKRSLVATVPVTFMVLIPEERTFFLLSLFILLSGLSVGTLFYPVFVQAVNLSSGMRKFKHAALFLMMATFLSAEFTALFVSRQDVMTSASFFLIMLVLLGFWFCVEATLAHKELPQHMLKPSPKQKSSTDGTTSESSPFFTRSQEES